MKSLFYNLAYGALNDAADDGVKENWYLFKDKNHGNKDYHPLGSPFKSNIYLTNPALQEWRDYMVQQNNDVYEVFDFDGYQIDQLGDRGTLYNYDGNTVNLASTFPAFIKAIRAKRPDCQFSGGLPLYGSLGQTYQQWFQHPFRGYHGQ